MSHQRARKGTKEHKKRTNGQKAPGHRTDKDDLHVAGMKTGTERLMTSRHSPELVRSAEGTADEFLLRSNGSKNDAQCCGA